MLKLVYATLCKQLKQNAIQKNRPAGTPDLKSKTIPWDVFCAYLLETLFLAIRDEIPIACR